MHVVFLHGPVAAGKHTIGRLLSDLTDLPLFHNHLAVDAALALFPFGSESFRAMRASIWLNAFRLAAESGSSFIFTFSPEATVEPDLIGRMTAAVTAQGGKILFVELVCSRETILRRLGSASRAKFKKLTDPELFVQVEREGGFAFPALPTPILSINTEQVSPQVAAESIARAVSRASHEA
jgi:hypothetical protein